MFSTRVGAESYEQPERNYRVQNNLTDILDEWINPCPHQLQPDDTLLFVRLSAIGDVIRAVPAIQYLRSNGFKGSLHWATHPPCDTLLEVWPGLDTVHRLTRENWWMHPFRFIEELRSLSDVNFDWVFDFHGLLKSAAVVGSANARHKVGFDASDSRELNHFFQDETIDPLPTNSPRILNYLSLLRPYTTDYTFRRDDFELPALPDESLEPAVKSLTEQNPILIHPRTSHDRYGQIKEWGTRNFEDLIKHILQVDVETPIRVTWGPGEKETADSIAAPFGKQVQTCPETPDLVNLCHLIDGARLLVSGDTAPCHIADVFQTPLVALFGGSNHFVSGPFFTDYRLITPRGDEVTTEDIPVRRVKKSVNDLLRRY